MANEERTYAITESDGDLFVYFERNAEHGFTVWLKDARGMTLATRPLVHPNVARNIKLRVGGSVGPTIEFAPHSGTPEVTDA